MQARVREATNAPFIKQLNDALIRLFGLTPTAIPRAYPRIWQAISRHAGSIRGRTISDHEAELRYVDPPTQLEPFDVVLFGHRATLLAMLEYAGQPGEVTVERDAEGPVFRMRW